jgi:hypothetical protein
MCLDGQRPKFQSRSQNPLKLNKNLDFDRKSKFWDLVGQTVATYVSCFQLQTLQYDVKSIIMYAGTHTVAC